MAVPPSTDRVVNMNHNRKHLYKPTKAIPRKLFHISILLSSLAALVDYTRLWKTPDWLNSQPGVCDGVVLIGLQATKA